MLVGVRATPLFGKEMSDSLSISQKACDRYWPDRWRSRARDGDLDGHLDRQLLITPSKGRTS
jgi:hypothetical protein